MTLKAHKLVWPRKMLDMFGGVLVSVSERDFARVHERCKSLQLKEEIFQGLFEIYLQISAWISILTSGFENPGIIGINGAQGTGKSTAAFVIKQILECCFDKKVCNLSLDDIYLTRQQRAELARDVHPLLVTRGVPGTHDIALGLEILSSLNAADDGTKTRIPVFDKANDDRRREDQWRVFSGRPDLILLEGWCVSARPQPEEALRQAINDLERLNDHDGLWRRFVNMQLDKYQLLFGQIDFLLMLKVPGFAQVYEWRLLQEQKLRQDVEAHNKTSRALMDEDQIRWFVDHYERLTRWMLDEMPSRADLVLSMNEAHQITGITLNRNDG